MPSRSRWSGSSRTRRPPAPQIDGTKRHQRSLPYSAAGHSTCWRSAAWRPSRRSAAPTGPQTLSQPQSGLHTQAASARVISLVLASSIVGRLLMGWLADRFAKKHVMLLIYLLVAGSIPLLFFAKTPGVIYLFAVIFGIGLGGDYMIIPLMAAELFGVRVLGRLMGVILTADGLTDATMPMLVGWLYDRQGSYVAGFSVLITSAVVGAIAIALLPKARERRLELS
ncbi:MAG: MFS transporter [Gemmatimonadaceae bacterium]